jgi:hypothetical protein
MSSEYCFICYHRRVGSPEFQRAKCVTPTCPDYAKYRGRPKSRRLKGIAGHR